MENKIGEYKLYAIIMKYSDYADQITKNNKSATYPTKQNKDF